MSIDEVREQLREWREDNSRHSEEVVSCWEEGLSSSLEDLGDEKWMVLEQVCVAGLDMNRPDIVSICFMKLVEKFGASSLRIRRLQAMRLEMEERWDEALEVLDGILEEDTANSSARKRKIAIWKAQGETDRAVRELVKYLNVFMSDQEGWLELCELYISEQEYSKAAYCIEELLLHNPHNHLYHQRHAEIRYTMGGHDNLELAKQYYCQAVKLAPSSMRALYGLLVTVAQLGGSPKCPGTKKKELLSLGVWATKQISSRYASVGRQESSALQDNMTFLKTLSIGDTE